jgi:hypothetical protein
MQRRFSALTFTGSLLVLTGAALADQPATATTAATTSSQAAASTQASEDTHAASLLRKAREAGYRTEVHGGTTQYCIESAEIGSHFKTKKCLNENQLELALERNDAAKAQLTNHTCTGCSGK